MPITNTPSAHFFQICQTRCEARTNRNTYSKSRDERSANEKREQLSRDVSLSQLSADTRDGVILTFDTAQIKCYAARLNQV